MSWTKTGLVTAGVVGWVLAGVGTGAAVDQCRVCHDELNPDIAQAFGDDVHFKAGLSCADCHGGNPALDTEDAMSPRYNFRGVPKFGDIPAFCGRCHSDPNFMRTYNPSLPTDQVEKYWTSKHGQLLKRGDSKVATCTSCHRTHQIQSARTPNSSVYPANVPKTCAACHADPNRMAEYGIPTDQYAQYSDSANVHGYALLVNGDMGAPACNDCHGNHGASPPGVENVGQVCTQCHALNGELFRQSPHKEAFDGLGVSECAFCHQARPDISDPHRRIHLIVKPTRALVGTGEGAVCVQCHGEGDGGWEMAAMVAGKLDSLFHRDDQARRMLTDAERRGFETSDARWLLDTEVRHTQMELRTALHSFNPEKYQSTYLRADTTINKVLQMGRQALREVGGRRAYFAVFTALTALLAVGIILKLREMERKTGRD